MRQMTPDPLAADPRVPGRGAKPVLRRLWHVGLPASILAMAFAVSVLHPDARAALQAAVPGLGADTVRSDCTPVSGGTPCVR